jgi:RND superfamily putative drug exporter
VNKQLSNDFGKSEKMSVPVTLIILLVAFGAIVAAGVPVLLALSAVGAAMGLSTLATHLIPSNGSVSEVILLMGMAVGVDYSLFYLKREREERARNRGRIDAIEVAAATSGHSIVVSAMAVIVSMAGLYLADDAIFSSIATGGVIVVAVAMIGSVTVLPALLAKLGRAVDRPKVPFLWRLTAVREGGPRLWPALLRPALRHPGRTLTISVLALLALAAPALGMSLHDSSADDLPRSIPVVQSYERMVHEFPSEGSDYQVVVKGQPAAIAKELPALNSRIAKDPLYTHDKAPTVKTSTDGRVTTIEVATPYNENSKLAVQGLTKLRSDIIPSTVGSVTGSQYAVGGDVAESQDYAVHQRDKLPLVVGFVLALTFLMMAITFRSIMVALTAIAINLLSAGAAFGILVGVFQHTWAEGLLKFHSNGSIVSWIPLFLFAVLFGLSMDYHVFVVSRIREGVEAGLSTKEAVRRGITRSAGVVTSAAIVMVSVFAIFATLSMIEMKQLGIGLAAAVLVDALVVRIVVLPSLMVLLGRANWWPSKLGRKTRAVVAQQPHSLEPVG